MHRSDVVTGGRPSGVPRFCIACGTALRGPYCYACGAAARVPARTARVVRVVRVPAVDSATREMLLFAAAAVLLAFVTFAFPVLGLLGGLAAFGVLAAPRRASTR